MAASDAGFLIYGSYGYTGELIAQLAVKRGLRPLLGGRNPDRLRAQADSLSLESCAFSLGDTQAMESALRRVVAVLHCAGPFSHTAEPMSAACLRTGTHYLDINGEIRVFEDLASLGPQAAAAGITLLPGVGFDVVPTDCLAAHLKARLPSAKHLSIGFQTFGTRFSRGTARGAIERAGNGAVIRHEGRLVQVPLAWKTRQINFGNGPTPAVTIPWGDVSTAYHSTGIPNIQVYIAVPALARRALALARYFSSFLSWAPVRNILSWLVGLLPAGPSAQQRASGQTWIWAEVQSESGERASSRMRTPEVYALTAQAALAAVQNILAGQAPTGFQTPSTAFGPDFVLTLEGVSRQDIL